MAWVLVRPPGDFILFFLSFLCLIINGVGNPSPQYVSKPYFGDETEGVVVQQGEVAFFNCHVHNLANQTVSWMRQQDGYPIYIGKEKFINDDRFELISNNWGMKHSSLGIWKCNKDDNILECAALKLIGEYRLRLKFSKAEDAGKFECQVSTNPMISKIFSLTVVVPSVSVNGDTEKHVMSGSPVHLECTISNCIKKPTYVFWYRSGARLVEEANGRVQVRTKSAGDSTAVSILSIEPVRKDDEGDYTCRPSSGGEATVRLHVVMGEILPRKQHDKTSSANTLPSIQIFTTGKKSLKLIIYIRPWIRKFFCFCNNGK